MSGFGSGTAYRSVKKSGCTRERFGLQCTLTYEAAEEPAIKIRIKAMGALKVNVQVVLKVKIPPRL